MSPTGGADACFRPPNRSAVELDGGYVSKYLFTTANSTERATVKRVTISPEKERQ